MPPKMSVMSMLNSRTDLHARLASQNSEKFNSEYGKLQQRHGTRQGGIHDKSTYEIVHTRTQQTSFHYYSADQHHPVRASSCAGRVLCAHCIFWDLCPGAPVKSTRSLHIGRRLAPQGPMGIMDSVANAKSNTAGKQNSGAAKEHIGEERECILIKQKDIASKD